MVAFAQFIEQQQVLVGMVGAALTGGALFALRSIPAKLVAMAREHLAVTLTVDSDDEVYRHLNVWLGRHSYAKRARRLMMQESFDYEQGRSAWQFTVGAGWHLIFYGRRPVLVHRHVQEASAMDKAIGGGKRERLTLMSLGRRQEPVRAIMEDAKRAYEGGGLVRVHFWSYGWICTDSRAKRDPASVFVPEAQMHRLVEDLTRFGRSRAEYRRRGVPYRRGYLLEGPPGTGKTTLIQVCAGVIDRDLYLINLNNVQGDNDLMAAFNAVGPDGVVVIEDIDTAPITRDRSLPVSPPAAPASAYAGPSNDGGHQPRGVTLSGLLNAIDGVAAREGRILFITSNHSGKLDPALVRPGRVDVRETIDLLGEDEAWRMFQTFRPEAKRLEFEVSVKPKLPISGAALQGLLLVAA